MKKLILSIAVVGAAMLVACSAEKKAEDKGAALKAKIENCSDPDSLKIYIDEAKDYADQLVKEGKDAAATDFLNEVTPAVKAKDPAAALRFTGLKLEAQADSALEAAKESAKNLADSTKAAVESAKDAAADKIKDAKDAAAEKVNSAKDAASEKVGEAKDAAKNAVDAAKTKAADAAQKGADKVKELMK
ncbi:MAG: hypothetical protein HDS44_02820 [Bacteroides sp.]|nr:hypothetical protein [Bacteroides sp.]MDE5826205.1 hypothetical protein [Duncaniella sp.]